MCVSICVCVCVCVCVWVCEFVALASNLLLNQQAGNLQPAIRNPHWRQETGERRQEETRRRLKLGLQLKCGHVCGFGFRLLHNDLVWFGSVQFGFVLVCSTLKHWTQLWFSFWLRFGVGLEFSWRSKGCSIKQKAMRKWHLCVFNSFTIRCFLWHIRRRKLCTIVVCYLLFIVCCGATTCLASFCLALDLNRLQVNALLQGKFRRKSADSSERHNKRPKS